jgi:hypothetical protein
MFTCGSVGPVHRLWVQLIMTQEVLDTLQGHAGLGVATESTHTQRKSMHNIHRRNDRRNKRRSERKRNERRRGKRKSDRVKKLRGVRQDGVRE